jgi:rod shape-determining protein MreD
MLSDMRFRLPLVVLTAMLVHTAVLTQVRIFGVMPDLMLLLAVSAGLEAGPAAGGITGFACGMVADLFLPTPLGLSALVFSLTGYVTGVTKGGLLRATWWFPLVTVFAASSVGMALFAVAGTVLGEAELLNGHLVAVMVVVGITNALLSPMILRLARWAFAGQTPAPVL